MHRSAWRCDAAFPPNHTPPGTWAPGAARRVGVRGGRSAGWRDRRPLGRTPRPRNRPLGWPAAGGEASSDPLDPSRGGGGEASSTTGAARRPARRRPGAAASPHPRNPLRCAPSAPRAAPCPGPCEARVAPAGAGVDLCGGVGGVGAVFGVDGLRERSRAVSASGAGPLACASGAGPLASARSGARSLASIVRTDGPNKGVETEQR